MKTSTRLCIFSTVTVVIIPAAILLLSGCATVESTLNEFGKTPHNNETQNEALRAEDNQQLLKKPTAEAPPVTENKKASSGH
ncbi:hypothetical protein D3C87_162590 [compost metagenome]